MAGQAQFLMTEEGMANQPGVRMEAVIIYEVCCRVQRTLALLVRQISVPADENGFTVDATCIASVTDLASAQGAKPLLEPFIRLCDLRATIAAAQFSCDELGIAVGVLELSTQSDDLCWMRDEWAAHNRRLEALVIANRAQLLAPEDPLKLSLLHRHTSCHIPL
ncbi:MAG: hypothetical protein EOO38_01135 [Cytophagaceae bacterium]|nr:MAG: hypothetical protein EOO38_01135 [Cytophagaceae bacterium]